MTPWHAVHEWAAGLDLLAQNPANCSAVELLQVGTIVAGQAHALSGETSIGVQPYNGGKS